MTNLIFILLSLWMMMISISITILTTKVHPIYLTIMIMCHNILLCINMILFKLTSMYAFLFFLIMISGLLIIFLYFSSLVSNTKSWSYFPRTTWVLFSMNLPTLSMMTPLYSPALGTSFSTIYQPMLLPLEMNETIGFMYKSPYVNLTLISMIYLLITLMTIIKITSPKIKTLRKC